MKLDTVICDAYAVRRLTLALLPRRLDRDDACRHVERAPIGSNDGWELFLRTERCANPLEMALRRTGCEDLLTEPARRTLRREAEWERGRISSARRQLATIATWAEESDARPVVLRGGLPALGPEGLDLNDVDVLLPMEAAHSLQVWLLELDDRRPGWAGRDHLRQLRQPGELAVEVHYALDGEEPDPGSGFWSRIREVPAAPGLWRLAPADHLWHVLTHQVVKHVPRRGRVRDLLLLRDALASCTPEEIDVTRRRVRGHRLSDLLELALEHALRWAQGPGVEDPYIDTALAGYLIARRKENRSKVYPTSGRTNLWVYALLAGPIERRAVWARIWTRTEDQSGHPVIHRVQSLNPILGNLLRWGARLVSSVARFVRACPLAVSIRRRVRRYRRAVAAGPHT